MKIPTIPKKIRTETIKLQKSIGQKKFFIKLLQLDPKIKNLVDQNDVQRSIRAYEVKKYTNKSLKDWFKNTKKNFEEDEFIKIYIEYPRNELIKNINKRVDLMFKNGAVKEVKRFLKLKIRKELSSNKIIGIETGGKKYNMKTIVNHPDFANTKKFFTIRVSNE